MQVVIDWIRKCPRPMNDDFENEIRPVSDADDFGEAHTPELREHEAAIRAAEFGLSQPTFTQGTAMNIAGINESHTMETRIGNPQQWEELVPQIDHIAGSYTANCYGVCWDIKPDCSFDYLTGVAVSSSKSHPAGMKTVTLDPLRYAVFSHTGHVSTIPKTIAAIWSRWVPVCGLKVANSPCFERYTSEFNPGTGIGGMEIWIPLEAPVE